MASINKVIIVGNLGRDPELRTFPSGDQMQMLGGRQGMGGQGGGHDDGYGDQGGGGYDQAPRRAAPAPMQQRPAAPAPRPAPAPVAQAPRAASGFDDMDDDIPF